jgi:thioredoxin-related protein
MSDLAALTLGETIVAFVDVVDVGESLKETFDIESTPSAVFVKDTVVYHIPRKLDWKATDVTDFIASNNVKEISNYLRKRVIGLNLYKEYAAKYLAENYFD